MVEAGVSQQLTDELVSEEVRQAILEALNQKTRIAVRCQLYIHPKKGLPIPTSCDVFLEPVENLHQRPVFVRQLLPLSGEGRPCSQLRSLVLIRSEPLVELLRAAEGANHLQWRTTYTVARIPLDSTPKECRSMRREEFSMGLESLWQGHGLSRVSSKASGQHFVRGCG